jgi:hypothetical protein
MNFIAGFLYITYKDEAKAFSVLKNLIKNNDMAVLYNTEHPMLKIKFYKLDRLISIILPDLH